MTRDELTPGGVDGFSRGASEGTTPLSRAYVV
jgi:hypothetical protein